MASYSVNPNKDLLDVLDSFSIATMRSLIPKHVVSYVAMLLSTLFLTPLSLLWFLKSKGHTLRVSKLTPLSIQKLTYTHPTSPLAISLGTLTLHPHLPTKSAPYLCTLHITNLEYKDSQVHTTIGNLEVTFWFFPVLFRVSCEPWVYSKVDDVRLRVFESFSEPWWVARLRNNVISTFLHGETVRLHDFRTKIYLNGIWGVTSTEGSSLTHEVAKPGLPPGQELDEARVRAQIEEWQIVNMQERMYTFGQVDIEVRRSWVEDRGSMVMIAKDGRWTKLPNATLREGTYRRSSWLWQALVGMLCVPAELFVIYRNPLAATDLHITRIDITYDTFHLSDAELVKQTAIKLRLMYDDQRREGLWTGVAWDTFFSNMVEICFPELKRKVEETKTETERDVVTEPEREMANPNLNALPKNASIAEDEAIEQEWIEFPSREGSINKTIVLDQNHPRSMN